MKNKMTGIILMVVGALLLGVGIFVFSNGKKQMVVTAYSDDPFNKQDVKADSLPIITVDSIVSPKKEMIGKSIAIVEQKDNELEKVIEMAIADGVLTTNERELIKKTALSKGVDYVAVLDDVEKRVKLLEIDSETELVDLKQKNGLDFEKFIVRKFDTDFFKVKEWAGDKFVKGVYAETTQHPDLLMEYIAFKKNIKFSVECKWRKNSVNEGIPFSTREQLDRYKDYAKEKNVPVFMAIGLGGKGASPERLFIVPLKDISKPFLFLSELRKFEKRDLKASFYYDYKKNTLK